ncbi:MAG: hypothetical protein SPI77_07130 [Corynebacterium sp.]|nr:hypothetical protein [Corynebacterium sp.]
MKTSSTTALAVGVLVAVGLQIPTAVAAEALPATAASSYIAAQLAEGAVPAASGTGKDYGLTLDAIIALDALGVAGKAADTALAEVHAQPLDPTNPWGAAKLIIAEIARGETPSDTAVQILTDSTDDSGAITGDTTTQTNFGQALGVIALNRLAAANPTNTSLTHEAAAATNYLASLQCTDSTPNLNPSDIGGFTLYGSCAVDTPSVDPDTTGIAAQALLAADNPAGRTAVTYLAHRALPNGAQDGKFTKANANTTALAASAFALAAQDSAVEGADAAYTQAAGFLRSLQYGCDTPQTIADQRGAIAYTSTADSNLAIHPERADQLRRSTFQATFALAGADLATYTRPATVNENPVPLTCTANDNTGNSGDSGNTDNSGNTGNTDTSGSSGSGDNTGAIIGGVIGALVLIAAIVAGLIQVGIIRL